MLLYVWLKKWFWTISIFLRKEYYFEHLKLMRKARQKTGKYCDSEIELVK